MQPNETVLWVKELMKEIEENKKDNTKLFQCIKGQSRMNKELIHIAKKVTEKKTE